MKQNILSLKKIKSSKFCIVGLTMLVLCGIYISGNAFAEVSANQNNKEYVQDKLSNISTSDKMVQANSNNTMIWPVPDFYMIDGNFGMRSDGTGPHSGIDIAAEGIDGALVVAVADGTVKYVNEEYSKGLGLGKQIKIQHENNVITVYAHLSEIKVKSGDIVKQGDMIGAVGSTGFSMKPRLRFEVRQIENNIALNPMKFLDLSQMP